MAELQKYKSHKVVEAMKIGATRPNRTGGALFHDATESGIIVEVDAKTFGRMLQMTSDLEGGYFVRYADGYESWSPAEAFEKGYRLLEEAGQQVDDLRREIEAVVGPGFDPQIDAIMEIASNLRTAPPQPWTGKSKIAGYRELSEAEIDLINAIKHVGNDELAPLIEKLAHDPDIDGRWVSIARTHFQEGLMALTRAITKPTFF